MSSANILVFLLAVGSYGLVAVLIIRSALRNLDSEPGWSARDEEPGERAGRDVASRPPRPPLAAGPAGE